MVDHCDICGLELPPIVIVNQRHQCRCGATFHVCQINQTPTSKDHDRIQWHREPRRPGKPKR